MLVYFLRHAEAEPDAENDAERKLTPKGLEQAERAAKFLAHAGLVPEVILASPVIRARQTAKIVAQKLGIDLIEADWLACGMATQTCLRELREQGKKASVLLVGHEPDFSETISAFLGLTSPAAVKIRKASLTAIEMPALECGRGRLQFLVPARLM